ncbi:uncharacterized protein LOC129589675 [Paramacrobiotus metropolitanus]|uniref:uncharacterized protein LOC129589675 n=1 Tax=Paramacrobiotus metropolitanus TaxID=2943436 RepID=UPI00244603DB|nr:uncharacterized protein LOC129589675 [Paramacrobiotus metropolitanus]
MDNSTLLEISGSADDEPEVDLDTHSLQYGGHPRPRTVLFVFVTICIGITMQVLQPRIPIPYTVVILLIGIFYGVLSTFVHKPLAEYTEIVYLDPHWILQIFLPVLLFESAFTLDFRIFRKLMGQILILATGGLAVATCLTAVVAKFTLGTDWTWLSCCMFGALISATDPVAVVALLKNVGTTPELSVVLEGESLLNDGTAIILFNVFLALSIPQDDFSGEWLAINSVLMVAGGPLFGFICGKIATFCISSISNDAILETSITLAAAYLTYYISEVLNISGVLAVVVLGLLMNYEGTVISPEVEPLVHEFWNTVTYLANTLIFAIVGITISERGLSYFTGMDCLNLSILYISVVVIRVISIGVFVPLIRYIQPSKRYEWKSVLVMSWGGLRGAVSLALAISVNLDQRIDQHVIGSKVLIHTIGIVLLTLCINGTTTAKLLQLLGMDRVSESRLYSVDNAINHILGVRANEIAVLKHDHFLADTNWEDVISSTNLPNPYRKNKRKKRHRKGPQSPTPTVPTCTEVPSSTHTCSSVISTIIPSEQDFQFTRTVWLTLLKRSFWEQFESGLISRHAFRFLAGCVDSVLVDPSSSTISADLITARWRIGHKLNYCQKILHKLTGHVPTASEPEQSADAKCPRKAYRHLARSVVHTYWFTSLLYVTITIHVTAAIVNLALNWHGHHLNEDFFHENIYFVVANGFFCLIYIMEIALNICAFGFLIFCSRLWNKLEILIVSILLVDLCLDIYVLAYGDGGTPIHKAMLRFFDVLSLLRVLRGIRLLKVIFPMIGKIMDGLVTHRLMHGFDIGKAFIIGQGEATRMARNIIRNDDALSHLQESAEEAEKEVWRDLGILLAERPDIAKAAKKRYVLRKVLHSMRADVKDLRSKGLLDDKTALIFRNTLEVKMDKASHVPYRATNADDLLKQVDWIQSEPLIRAFLLVRSTISKFSKRQKILLAGQEPFGVIVIVSGIIKSILVRTLSPSQKMIEEEESLTSGCVIGDYQILSGKRSSTTFLCQTNVQAITIPKGVMELAIVEFPCLRQSMWNVWGFRLVLHLLLDQPTFQHYSIDQLRRKVAKGHAVLVDKEVCRLQPSWELIVLVHGKCTGFPQQITLEGPKIVSNRFESLHFANSQFKHSDWSSQPVIFVIKQEYVNEQREPDTDTSYPVINIPESQERLFL